MRRRRARASAAQLALFEDLERAPTALSRATARGGSRAFEAPAPKPWQCVVLGVDTAKRSGWAVSLIGKLHDSDELDTLDEPTIELVVMKAVALAEQYRIPIVMVLESPWGGSVQIIAALGVARERWKRAWRRAGQAAGRCLLVTPSSWRGPVLGAYWVSQPRAAVRRHEQLTARGIAGRVVGPDEAPAILIARWGAHAARVGRAIGKRASKASLRAWTRG